MPVDAAVAWPNGMAYLFSGTTYSRYDFATGAQDQPPAAVVGNWPGLPAAAADAVAVAY